MTAFQAFSTADGKAKLLRQPSLIWWEAIDDEAPR
jgi:hypothetical protein